ncbi:hypothetical protein AALP_AAs70636U001300 [Arabis alpina]|uniref:Uncharacterized protein n=1 Tax=Arabis alpina TaxID=50452 RepID=A0A087G1B2_ARAAL|nr:hypothetical protein AALP_AAs70636U001300 [Arabis alpina]
MLDASIPIGVPLAGPSDRRSSDASSPEVELPEHLPEVVPPQETGASVARPVLKDSTEDGSSYVRFENHSRGSYPSDRVETDEGTSGGDKGSIAHMVKLNLDVVDSDEELELPEVAPVAEREGLRPDKAPIAHGRDQKNLKLNTQNGELVAESNRSLEVRRKAEQEVVKFKDLLDHSQRMNNDLIAEQDILNLKVADLTSALAEAEEMRKEREMKKKAKDKLRRSLEIMEERSRAQTEVDRFASLASQVVGAIRRMEKTAKDGVPIDAAKKEKLEARLAGYIAEADKIVLPPLLVDSSATGESIDAATGEPIAPLFSHPDANPEEQEQETAP